MRLRLQLMLRLLLRLHWHRRLSHGRVKLLRLLQLVLLRSELLHLRCMLLLHRRLLHLLERWLRLERLLQRHLWLLGLHRLHRLHRLLRLHAAACECCVDHVCAVCEVRAIAEFVVKAAAGGGRRGSIGRRSKRGRWWWRLHLRLLRSAPLLLRPRRQLPRGTHLRQGSAQHTAVDEQDDRAHHSGRDAVAALLCSAGGSADGCCANIRAHTLLASVAAPAHRSLLLWWPASASQHARSSRSRRPTAAPPAFLSTLRRSLDPWLFWPRRPIGARWHVELSAVHIRLGGRQAHMRQSEHRNAQGETQATGGASNAHSFSA